MKPIPASALVLALGAIVAGGARAGDGVIVKPNAAHRFATLPAGVAFPEGIAVNPRNGDIYVSTFNPNPGANNTLLRFNKTGKLLAQKNFEDTPLLGPAFNGIDAKVYITNNGADGIALGPSGHLWVAANQGDHVVALDANGLVVVQLGAFLGIRHDGAVRGLLFPASVAIRGHKLFVTNLALPLNGDPDDEVEEMVTQYTISRINLPPLHD